MVSNFKKKNGISGNNRLRRAGSGVRGRPKLPRNIGFTPNAYFFKPKGTPLRNLETEVLSREELEAIRLKNVQELHQQECAQKMGVSQSTFQRMLATANKKIATALVEGKAIRIFKE